MSVSVRGWLGMTQDPIFLAKYRLKTAIERTLRTVLREDAACLDVGCGVRPYEHLFQGARYFGMDVPISGRSAQLKRPDCYYDGVRFPFRDGVFDLVFSTQVLEHVRDLAPTIAEIARVCRKDGKVVISVPFVFPEHEEPFDFLRFTRFGIRHLLSEAGLEVQHMEPDSGAPEAIATLFNLYVIENLVPEVRGAGRAVALVFCFPLQLLALLMSRVFRDRKSLYLNLVVVATKK